MTITHHLDDATLMSFAAGSLPDALSAVAAAHVAMCARCSGEVAALESIGGVLLGELSPALLNKVEIAPAGGQASAGPISRDNARPRSGDLPGPLARLIGSDLHSVRWRWLGPGLWHHRLQINGKGNLGLVKVTPGHVIPEHSHGGSELTLVLRGPFRDATGHYSPGDVADLDDTVEHTPIADPGPDCICLVANENPARFRGVIARLLQPLHGM